MISQSKIDNVELFVDFQKLFTSNIEPLCWIEDKRFRQCLYIVIDSIRRNFSAAGDQIVRDAADGNRTAYHACKIFGDCFQQRNIRDLSLAWVAFFARLPVLNIFDNDRVVDAL